MGNTQNKNNNKWEGDIYIYKGGKISILDKGKIKHVRIHQSVSIVHDEAFAHCTNLQTVIFSKNHKSMIKKLGNESFYECYKLTSINLQDTQIETIGNYTFYHCNFLTTVHFPSTVRQIGKSCFYACDQLKAVDLSHAKDLEVVEEGAFKSCSTLRSVILSPTVSHIESRSFYGCNALETVDIRSTRVNEIGAGAFRFCINLSTVYFPKTTRRIGEDSFYNCEKLTFLDLQMTSIERIGDNAFYKCVNLKTIKFPKTLKLIGAHCFYFCNKLESLNLQETSIERIEEGAFGYCRNLATVVGISSHHQEKLHEILGDEIFRHYGHMRLPASLVGIGKHTFFKCPSLKNSIDNNWIHYECDINRGGRRFLQRDHRCHHDNDGGDTNESVGKAYCSSLWPLILYRVMNKMKLPKHRIYSNDDDLSLYTYANPLQRRASVVFHLLVNGVIADLQSLPGTFHKNVTITIMQRKQFYFIYF